MIVNGGWTWSHTAHYQVEGAPGLDFETGESYTPNLDTKIRLPPFAGNFHLSAHYVSEG
jgi:hypothetical protein